MRTLLIAIILVTATVSSAIQSDAKTRLHVTPDLTHLPPEDLIARFQNESAASIMEDEKADIDTFVAVPPPTKFRVDLVGTPFPQVSPTMRELVRRGVAVVPALLDHLSDARPTKLGLRGKTAGEPYNASFLGNEYDPRQPDADKVPPGLFRICDSEHDHSAEQFKTYRLKVGDLCSAALGQIVNRRLIGWRNWAGVMFGFNSPVHSPTLAAATRADWTGLTDDGFRDFLVHDVEWLEERTILFITDPRNLHALQRLLFYYPTDGVALAVKLLERPLIDTAVVKAYCERLTDTSDEAEQDRLFAEFRTQHSQDACECLAQAVAHIATLPLDDGITPPTPEWIRQHGNAVKIADRRLTSAEKHPTFLESQFDCEARREAVTSMALYPSAEIDAAARRMLKRVFALRLEDLPSQEDQRNLVVACAERLLPPSRRKELEKASSLVNRKFWPALNHERGVPVSAYLRARDAFLQRMAADPALLPPTD